MIEERRQASGEHAADSAGNLARETNVAETRTGPGSVKPWMIVLVVAALVLLRLLFMAQYVAQNPLAQVPLVDAKVHHETACSIAAGRLVLDQPFIHPPLYPYLLALIYTVVGVSPLGAIGVQLTLGLLGLWLLFRLARRYAGREAALVALLLAGLYGPLAFFELKLLPASLGVLLALLLLNGVANWLVSRRWGWSLFCGVVAGLLVLDRPNWLFLPGLLILWLLFSPQLRRSAGRKHGRRAAFLMALAMVLTVAPAWLHNRAAGDGSVLLCRGGGLNFYLGNRQGAEVSFTEAEGGMLFGGVSFVDPAALAANAAIMFERENKRPPRNGREVETFWIGKTLGEMAGDPWAWIGLQFRKLEGSVSSFEYGVNTSYAAEKGLTPVLALFIVPFWVLAALGGAGLCLGWLRRCRRDGTVCDTNHAGKGALGVSRGATEEQCDQERVSAALAMVFALVLLSLAAATAFFFCYSRFRLPVVPVLAIFGGDAVATTVATLAARMRIGGGMRRRSIRSNALSIVLPVVVALIAAWIASRPPENTARRQVAGGHALVGAAYFRLERLEEAAAAYTRSVDVDPSSVKARQTHANLCVQAGRWREAARLHEEAIGIAPNDPQVLRAAAFFFKSAPAQIRDLDRAESLARRAAELLEAGQHPGTSTINR